MSGFEFGITISAEWVVGTFGPVGADKQEVARERLPEDKLVLDTALLLDEWLNQWDRIERSPLSNLDRILSPKTFRIIGAHLWRLILRNKVGGELERVLCEPQGDVPLRVLINFTDNAKPKLKGLPWEFLYCDAAGVDGVFVAAETNLLLTRYVPLAGGRTPIDATDRHEKLRVLLIVALPKKGFGQARYDVTMLTAGIGEIAGIEVLPPVQDWDQHAIQETLRQTPCHIVHVVGLCKGEPGEPKIYLGGQNGSRWQDPKPLIDALTPVGVERPRLVILQLCELEDGDADENFERLAPDLMRRQIPAVLAMQYPMPTDDADWVGVDFYRQLAEGTPIGAAVQVSRNSLYRLDQLNRRFGTPVLYLQDDGALVRPPAAVQQPMADALSIPGAPSRPSRVNAAAIGRRLRAVIDIETPDEAGAARYKEWVSSVSWPDDPQDAWLIVHERSRSDVDPDQAKRVYEELMKALVTMREGHDG